MKPNGKAEKPWLNFMCSRKKFEVIFMGFIRKKYFLEGF